MLKLSIKCKLAPLPRIVKEYITLSRQAIVIHSTFFTILM